MTIRIAVVGDHDPAITAHQAIPLALERAAREVGTAVGWDWVGTATIGTEAAARLAACAGVWCAPGSPYVSTAGALAAIRHARERSLPFLGTCGGFQHAMLEYAQSAWGVAEPAHAELDPAAADPVIASLACGLVEVNNVIRPVAGTRLARIYGAPEASEGYRCRYGLGVRYAARLAEGPLRVSARDAAGEVRAVELETHPFYHATLFQPERSALAGRPHPLITAFVAAAAAA